MFKIGSLVEVFVTLGSFIGQIVGFDYDKEVVFVQKQDDERMFAVTFSDVESI